MGPEKLADLNGMRAEVERIARIEKAQQLAQLALQAEMQQG